MLELFAVAALYYLVMTTAWDFVQRRIERYYGRAYGPASMPANAELAVEQR